ncbi:unnamed protein product [Notodromas monacha]|uniref:C2H2-type domain-containing protein n=1 Tax=Notodromas monacha TaxID=399045 RepID=A0A7R9GA70_9CRUS|nr:unnamed protein product [Notodromas monacha]CAG0915039.1 unnamed protein product [Notodromas monacha]
MKACVVCLRRDREIVADGREFIIPDAASTVFEQFKIWTETREHPQIRSLLLSEQFEVCQSCLDLILETRKFEASLEKCFSTLWTLFSEFSVPVPLVTLNYKDSDDALKEENLDSCEISSEDSSLPQKDEILRKRKSNPLAKPTSCKYCGEVMPSVSRLQIHVQIHRRMHCTECGKEFRGRFREKALAAHIAVDHLGVHPHSCAQCDARFSSTAGLKYHMERLHSTEENKTKHPCDKCDKVFDTKLKLNAHKQTHCTEICPICGKTLKGMGYSTIKKHIESTHEQKKKYGCEFCEEKFVRTQQLYKHQADVHSFKSKERTDVVFQLVRQALF